MPTNGVLDFRAPFGVTALAQTRESSNSVTEHRTRDGIIVGAIDNKERSMLFLSTATGRTFVSDHFTVIPTPDSTIAYMTSLAAREGRKVKQIISVLDCPRNEPVLEEEEDKLPPGFFTPEPAADGGVAGPEAEIMRHSVEPMQSLPLSLKNGEPTPKAIVETTVTPAAPPLLARSSIDDEAGSRSGPASVATAIVETSATAPPLPARSYLHDEAGSSEEPAAASASRASLLDMFRGAEPKALALHISVKKAVQQYGDRAGAVIRDEMQNMLTREVWHPVLRSNLTGAQAKAIIRSSMFIKEKLTPQGVFDKLKARIVGGGDQQDRSLYKDLSAPTVSTTSFFSVAGIAAAENRKVISLDVGVAYLNAAMDGTVIVHMSIDPALSAVLVDLDPTYRPFLDYKGMLVVALDKALYGCIESANLWYKNISATLIGGGYVSNPVDPCVFNKTGPTGTQCTLALHVDDILATSADAALIEEFVDLIHRTYHQYTVQEGPVLGHLGMTLDYRVPGQVSITMEGCVQTLMSAYDPQDTAVTPATSELFVTREPDAPGNRLATPAEHKKDRSALAVCLYMAKRTYPQLGCAVAFLTTRVNQWSLDDHKKLQRVLKYIKGLGVSGLIFRFGLVFTVTAWVDASYGTHADGKSHTGCAITVGDVGTVYAKSSKQKIVTKSSTEAELVAVSDSANQGFFVRNFIAAQGHSIGPLIIYQDNMSCMSLLAAGRSNNERTRHVAIRYFWINERVDNGEARVLHKDGKDLFANVLTKPLQNPQFEDETRGLTNW
jgi:hypothetical protein